MNSTAKTEFSPIAALCADAAAFVSSILFFLILGAPDYALRRRIFLAPTQMGATLIVALIAGILAAMMSSWSSALDNRLSGVGGRVGVRAAFRASLLASSVLTCLATLDAFSAQTAAADIELRHRMWLTLFVSLAAIMPGVLSGFVGGFIGVRVVSSKFPSHALFPAFPISPWMSWCSTGITLASVVFLMLPFTFLGRPLREDPPPVVEKTPESVVPQVEPSRFHYSAPHDITNAKPGQIQVDFIKEIEGVANDGAVSLSADGISFAYCDRSTPDPRVTVFDLDSFSSVVSFKVPAFPQHSLAWSPDGKALACTVNGSTEENRIWILNISSGKAVELPRPRDRDTPSGDLFWWREDEAAFFPNDEPPLAFDLKTLAFRPVADSAFIKSASDETRKFWLEGRRLLLPSSKGCRLELNTVPRTSQPPSRRDPEGQWRFTGSNVCSLASPDTPVAYGLGSLPVAEGMRILFSPDASRIVRVGAGRALVTYMKVAAPPSVLLEASMPLSFDNIEQQASKHEVSSGEVCAFAYAPLVNPLTRRTVGPDYSQVKGILRLLQWQGRKAVFLVAPYDQNIAPTDVISTLHKWNDGNMTPWHGAGLGDWWSLATVLPEVFSESAYAKIALPPLDAFTPLTLQAQGTSFVAVKQPRRSPSAKIPQQTAPPINMPPPLQAKEDEVRQFIVQHHQKASKGDVDGMTADYNEVVDFLDKGLVSRDSIRSDELEHREKWSKGTEVIWGAVRLTSVNGVWNASYSIEFRNENNAGDSQRGKADVNLIVRNRVEGWRIYDQKAKVYDVVSNSAGSKQLGVPAVLQPVATSLPRPCYTVTMRTGDSNDIEITDHISFAGGIAWHRTYRQISKDNKVTNICRAIYEGTGGVSLDGKSARIYVGSQGWDRGLGTSDFVRLCERSAAAFVGREFQFRFTSDGMVESQGISFKIQR